MNMLMLIFVFASATEAINIRASIECPFIKERYSPKKNYITLDNCTEYYTFLYYSPDNPDSLYLNCKPINEEKIACINVNNIVYNYTANTCKLYKSIYYDARKYTVSYADSIVASISLKS